MPQDDQTTKTVLLTRRTALVLGGSAVLAACTRGLDVADLGVDPATTGSIRPKISVDPHVTNPTVMYASITEGPYVLPTIPYEKIPREFRRQIVQDPTGEQPGTVVVDLKARYLYLVQPGGDALRYGVGIGRAGFEWSGRANIQYKKQWPVWTPPAEMIARKPELVKWTQRPAGRNGQPAWRAGALYLQGWI